MIRSTGLSVCADPGQRRAGAGLEVPLWILGSSLYGAQVAAYLGLPFAFASHFAPAMMMDAMKIYRERFRPSAQLAAPNVMLGVVVVAAASDREARFLFSSLQQSSLNNRTGHQLNVVLARAYTRADNGKIYTARITALAQ